MRWAAIDRNPPDLHAFSGLEGHQMLVRFGLAAVIHVGVSPTKVAKSGAARSQVSFEPEADELRD